MTQQQAERIERMVRSLRFLKSEIERLTVSLDNELDEVQDFVRSTMSERQTEIRG